MQRYVWKGLSTEERSRLLRRPALEDNNRIRAGVAAIVERVRRGGDEALIELTEELDGVRLSSLAVSAEELDRADADVGEEQKRAIASAAANIERFHAAQLTSPVSVETAPGVVCERLTRPLRSVGLYVPAGSAPLPSTALMLAVPARLAGCPMRVLCTPAQANGRADSAVLYVARLCGVSAIFKLGGAQAIAAMAYGTETVPKVDKLFGPGNVWVAAAKAQVAQDPLAAAQDLPAGPSEVLVIADRSAVPAFVAADLLSQAEHGPDSQAILIATSEAIATAVLRALAEQQTRLTRKDIVAAALERSYALVVDDLETALDISNQYAPEHLILQIEEPRRWVDAVHCAGSVFLGPWTPESVGDYCSGTNHVLPTYGFARSHSSLGVSDFMRSLTVQEVSASGLQAIGPTACVLAEMERLDAHGRAVSIRLDALRNGSRG
jgi:histidinol dehydrogenase